MPPRVTRQQLGSSRRHALQVVGRDEGERLQFGRTTILLRSAGDEATVWEEIEPLVDTPLHVHAREDEIFHIIDGEHAFRCGEQEFRVEPGAFVFLPRGVPTRTAG